MRIQRLMIVCAMTLLVPMLSGCHGWRKTHKGSDKQSVATSQTTSTTTRRAGQSLTVRDINYNTLTASFTCTVEGMNVSGQMRILHDSIIWVSCSKIIEVGRAMLTPTRVQAYSRLLNKSVDGDYAMLRSRWGIDIDFHTLQALLVGNQIPGCEIDDKPMQKGDSVAMAFRQTGSGRTVCSVVQVGNGKITNTKIYSPAEKQSVECRYGKMHDVAGQLVPHEVTVALQCRRLNTSTTLKLSSVRINEPQSYPFVMPVKK